MIIAGTIANCKAWQKPNFSMTRDTSVVNPHKMDSS